METKKMEETKKTKETEKIIKLETLINFTGKDVYVNIGEDLYQKIESSNYILDLGLRKAGFTNDFNEGREVFWLDEGKRAEVYEKELDKFCLVGEKVAQNLLTNPKTKNWDLTKVYTFKPSRICSDMVPQNGNYVEKNSIVTDTIVSLQKSSVIIAEFKDF